MSRPPFEHVSTEDLAAYLDGEGGAALKARVQAHLVECDECRAEVTELASVLETEHRRRSWAIGLSTAAAAAVAALVLVGPFGSGVEEGGGPRFRAGSSVELEAVAQIPVLTPVPGATLQPAGLIFSWESLPDGATYRLTLTDQGGDPLWAVETDRPEVSLPQDVRLEPGQRYLWFVDALLVDGTQATTGVQSFTVRP